VQSAYNEDRKGREMEFRLALSVAISSVLTVAGVYVLISIIPFAVGAFDNARHVGDGSCRKRPRNIERFFPAYKFGCWLGSRQGKAYYWSEHGEEETEAR
jgi:hypothetical protein